MTARRTDELQPGITVAVPGIGPREVAAIEKTADYRYTIHFTNGAKSHDEHCARIWTVHIEPQKEALL